MRSNLKRTNRNTPAEFNSVKKIWESHATDCPEADLLQAKKYLKKLPAVVGPGPSVALVLDLGTSQFKGYKGSFKNLFGIEYKDNMHLFEFSPFVLPSHNNFILKHFPTYVEHIIQLSPARRNQIELSVVFKFNKNNNYRWLSFRTYKYFSKCKENLGLVNVEYTDITNIKFDKYAKFIVYDKKKGYIVNAALHDNAAILDILTPTELEITKHIAHGLFDKEIAVLQGSALDTVKQHKRHIFSKLEINKSTELVAIAYECGLV